MAKSKQIDLDTVNVAELRSTKTYTEDEILLGTHGPKAVSGGTYVMEDLTVVDPKTGIASEGKVYERRREFLYGGNYTMLLCKNWEELWGRHKLTTQENQLLAYALNNSIHYNYVSIVAKEVQERFGIGAPGVSKAVAKFLEIGLLRKCAEAEIPEFLKRKGNWFQINASFFWNGETADRPSEPEGYRIGNRLRDRENPSLEDAFLKTLSRKRGK
jgi:hypothetical protein